MSTFFDLQTESIIQDGFYVPMFEVQVNGANLPQGVLRDVVEITYQDSVDELDSFEITVNNWDADKRTFKYVGAETPQSLKDKPLHSLFTPCNKSVTVVMGYTSDPRVMLTGNFTTMEPNFPNSGSPTLTVRGLNVLHKLRQKKATKTWKKKKISDVVKSLERDLPIPIVIDTNAMLEEEPIEFVAMRNMYHIDFILKKAKEREYVVYIQEAKDGGQAKLYFGKSQNGISGWTDFSFELEWGKSLIDFRPTLTTANQVSTVTVRDWQRNQKSGIEETVSLDDIRPKRNEDLYDLLGTCDPRETVEVDEPVFTRQQARQLAMTILKDRQRKMLKASGTTVGLADLRAGKKLRILGVGSRFSGTYFVTSTTHTINDSGYITKFNAFREAGLEGAE